MSNPQSYKEYLRRINKVQDYIEENLNHTLSCPSWLTLRDSQNIIFIGYLVLLLTKRCYSIYAELKWSVRHFFLSTVQRLR